MPETFTKNTTFTVMTCPYSNCGFVYGMPVDYLNRRLDDGTGWYCPRCKGSMGYWEKESDKQIKELKEKLANAKSNEAMYRDAKRRAEVEATHQAARANGYKGQLALVKKRIANGVCPCCNRYFENLHRHMQNKHSDFIEESGLILAMDAPTPEAFDAAVTKACFGVSSGTEVSYRSIAGKIRRMMFPEVK